MSDAKEPRKATEVILELENKVDTLLGQVATISLNIGIISNKLNDLLAARIKEAPKFTVETANTTPPPVVVDPEAALPMENNPVGFRRTSRPETFAGDNSYLNKIKKPLEEKKYPIQIPRGNKSEVIVPSQAMDLKQSQESALPQNNVPKQSTGNSVPVSQRIVDKNGKAVFLADVIVIDSDTNESVFTTRTNGIGKWVAPLPMGNYLVTLRKRDPVTREPVEVTQNITVDGTKSPLELSMCIITN